MVFRIVYYDFVDEWIIMWCDVLFVFDLCVDMYFIVFWLLDKLEDVWIWCEVL